MASIQQNLFSWQELDETGDLERLLLVLSAIDDESFMRKLEQERGKGRNDYPVRAMWNSVLAAIVYGHESIESLRRELSRNGDLLRVCGFEIIRGEEAVPSSNAYSRFLKILLGNQEEIDRMLDEMVEALRAELPGFGRHLAIDSKGIRSHARSPNDKSPDGRRDTDADLGVKKYRGKREDGSLWEKVKSWFGYKLHLIVDADYELPIAYRLTKATCSDTKQLPPMMEELEEKHSELVKGAQTMGGDKGYDSEKNNRELWDNYKIKPVIAICEKWKETDGEDTRILFQEKADNIVYDNKGNVYCVCPASGDKRKMSYCGFEKERECLKYRCPVARKGTGCKGQGKCGTGEYGEYGRIIRIPLAMDRRIFTPLARASYSFKREYKKRTAVERVNSRLDVSFGFEHHFIRGMEKMRMRSSLAILVMLAMALGRIRQEQHEYMRSLVKRPAA